MIDHTKPEHRYLHNHAGAYDDDTLVDIELLSCRVFFQYSDDFSCEAIE